MTKPRLKRIKVSTEQELRNWLAKNSAPQQEVMIVTCNKNSREKPIGSAQVRRVLGGSGWIVGHSQTLVGNLSGHVISHP
jgi:hypothetical protein